ncbi:transposase [Moorena sp. SIO4A5]|uniref:IS66 family transposase n=1 Tax=Moorena sp. SIO4A5 TaxID=2607838 RepID=UPI0013C98A20|nr:transposase [Moorena sp. SIO4A5]NEO20685.1 transposase [Moorena sp. SIO4A5]
MAGDTPSRGELISQLGQTYDGVLITDDYSVYNGYYRSMINRSESAHLRRHFLRLIKQPLLHNRAIGEAKVELIDEACKPLSSLATNWRFNGLPTLGKRIHARRYRQRFKPGVQLLGLKRGNSCAPSLRLPPNGGIF